MVGFEKSKNGLICEKSKIVSILKSEEIGSREESNPTKIKKYISRVFQKKKPLAFQKKKTLATRAN